MIGGVSTSFASLKANLWSSTAVALTGIALPIALSFLLKCLWSGTTNLQAFAAGAALCSTSLGTTFSVLNASGLTSTRLGTVLATAAMLDDVVGLIMLQVISNLGGSGTSISSITVIRPIVVSVALVIALMLFCRLFVLPLTSLTNHARQKSILMRRLLSHKVTVLSIHTLILLGLVTGATYAGTSNLFAAYVTGVALTWWDTEVPHPPRDTATTEIGTSVTREADHAPVDNMPEQSVEREGLSVPEAQSSRPVQPSLAQEDELSGHPIYQEYYKDVVNFLLKPFFFASIGFSIPISQLFNGSIVWRGLVYFVLMMLAKLLTGLWLVRLTTPNVKILLPRRQTWHHWTCWSAAPAAQKKPAPSTEPKGQALASEAKAKGTEGGAQAAKVEVPLSSTIPSNEGPRQTKPLSLYPASILGFAMVSRGEIGFLIASVGQSKGIFSEQSSEGNAGTSAASDLFLIIIWAITLCTIVGPVSVGILVKRVRRLQTGSSARPNDPLGSWGVG